MNAHRLLGAALAACVLGCGFLACGGQAPSPTDEAVSTTAQAIDGTHPAFPQVPDQSGQILKTPRLVTILAGNDVSTGNDTAANLLAFSAALPASAMWASVASEYGVGALTSATSIAGAYLLGGEGSGAGGAYTKADLQAYVSATVASAVAAGNKAAAADGKTIYLLYVPAHSATDGGGLPVTLDPGEFGSECGDHFEYPGSATDAIGVVQRCTPYQAQETQLGQLTRVASHELVEAATNPRRGGYNFAATVVPGVSNIWSVWNGGDVELADLCEGTRYFQSIGTSSPSGGWEFTRIWSNAAAAAGGDPCVPAISDPYYSVAIPGGWYTVHAGQTIDIPFTGWSSVATTNWFINAGVASSDGSFSVALPTSSLGESTPTGCGARYAMNAGATGSVAVTAPVSATPGQYTMLRLTSFRETSSSLCNPEETQDFQHFTPVGVCVGATSCGSEEVCGTIDDGCGGTIGCGICRIAGQSCVNNRCERTCRGKICTG